VVELPVEDGAGRQEPQVFDFLDLDAPAAEAEDAGGGEDGQGVRAVALPWKASTMVRLAAPQSLAVVCWTKGTRWRRREKTSFSMAGKRLWSGVRGV
jgi:hypothetical protein